MPTSTNIADRRARHVSLPGQVRERAVVLLAELFAELPDPFEELLFDCAMNAGSRKDAFLDAAGELRRRRQEIFMQFHERLQQSWDALQEGHPQQVEDAFAGSLRDPLSLVTDQELELRLATRSLAETIRRECKDALAELDARMICVAGDPVPEGWRNPVGPEQVGMAVYRSFAICDFAPEARLELIQLCEARLVPGMARAYAALNEWLAQAGVEPRMPARPSSAPKTAADAPAHDVAELDDEVAGAPRWASRFLDRIVGLPPASGAAAHAGAAAVVPLQDQGDAPSVQGVLLEALHYLLRQSRQANVGAGESVAAAGVDAPHRRDLSQHEMLSVLSLLQTAPAASLSTAADDTGGSLAQRLKNEVFDRAQQLGLRPIGLRRVPLHPCGAKRGPA